MSLQTVAKKLGGVPTGGTTGQVLVKNSATSYDVGWATGSGGGGGSSFPPGTAAAPGWPVTGDLGTGLYQISASNLAIALAGTRRMSFEGSGATGGLMTLGPTGATYLRSMANDVGGLSLESTLTYAFVGGKVAGAINGNAYYDGAAWNKYDTAVGSSHISAGQGGINMYVAATGAGPNWVNRLAIQGDGLVDLSGGFRVGGTVQPSSGVGVEIFMGGTTLGHVHGYNRTSAAYIDMQLTGKKITIQPLGGGNIVFGSGGVVYDPGWPVCFHGNPITDGRFYQQANGGAYCIDITDCSTGVVGSKIVQRTPEGYIYGNYINLSADVQGGAPAYVAGQNGDGFVRWYPKA